MQCKAILKTIKWYCLVSRIAFLTSKQGWLVSLRTMQSAYHHPGSILSHKGQQNTGNLQSTWSYHHLTFSGGHPPFCFVLLQAIGPVQRKKYRSKPPSCCNNFHLLITSKPWLQQSHPKSPAGPPFFPSREHPLYSIVKYLVVTFHCFVTSL